MPVRAVVNQEGTKEEIPAEQDDVTEPCELAPYDRHRIQRRDWGARERQSNDVHPLCLGSGGSNDLGGSHRRQAKGLEDPHIHR